MLSDFARTYEDSVLPVEKAGLLREIELPFVFFDDGSTRVWAQELSGHTPGHLVVHVADETSHFILTGDAIHHPFQVSNLGLIQDGDFDTAKASRSRVELVEMALASNAVLLPAHFPSPTAGRFVGSVDELGFEWATDVRS